MKSFVTLSCALGLLAQANASAPAASQPDALYQALQIATTVTAAEIPVASDYAIGTSCITGALPVVLQGSAKDLQLQNFKVRVLLRQHSALVVVEGEIYNHSDSKQKLVMGVPFIDMGLRGSTTAAVGPLNNPISSRLSACNLILGGLETKTSWMKGQHPQASAPSLEFLDIYNNFLQFNANLKPKKATSFYLSYTTELNRQVDISPKNGTRTYFPGKFYFDLSSARMYAHPVLNFSMLVNSEEQLVGELKIDKKFVLGEAQAEWKAQALAAEDMLRQEISVDSGYVLSQDAQKSSFNRAGKKLLVHGNYSILPSSSNEGENCGAEKLKDGSGFWQETVEGNGKGQFFELKLATPQRLHGLVLGIGQNPTLNPALSAGDCHGLYQSNPRPARFKVTLNGEYSFFASVADFWDAQVILNPGYVRKVSNVRLEIVDVYPSKSGNDLSMSRLQLITAAK